MVIMKKPSAKMIARLKTAIAKRRKITPSRRNISRVRKIFKTKTADRKKKLKKKILGRVGRIPIVGGKYFIKKPGMITMPGPRLKGTLAVSKPKPSIKPKILAKIKKKKKRRTATVKGRAVGSNFGFPSIPTRQQIANTKWL